MRSCSRAGAPREAEVVGIGSDEFLCAEIDEVAPKGVLDDVAFVDRWMAACERFCR